jgi:Fe-Mn family superoxide dismutase
MCYDKTENKLFNVWVNEHDGGYLAGCEPILVMDVFEHAYMTDYETKRVDYINAFIKAINGKILNSRFARIEV